MSNCSKFKIMIDELYDVVNEVNHIDELNIYDKNNSENILLHFIDHSEIALGVEELLTYIYNSGVNISKKSFNTLKKAGKNYVDITYFDGIISIDNIDKVVNDLYTITNELSNIIADYDIKYINNLIYNHKICISVEFILTCIVQNDIILSQATYDILMGVVKQCDIHEDYYQDIKHSES